MADYTQPDVVNKRVRFFDGQFLQDQDFIDEQKFHLDRERRQSQLLRVTGVVSGLTVTKSGSYQVTVAKGMAVDTLGRQLVLAADLTLRLTDKFAKEQGVELYLVYQESPTDVAQTGGKSARRWDESPKIVALAPDGTVAVAPEGVSATYEGPSVLLARLAVADNGDVTVDATAARKAGLSVPGAVGIGTTTPSSDLEIGNFDARNRYLTLKVSGGNQYRSGVKMWAWQENYGYSVEYDERGATGNGLHVRTHDRNTDGTTRLFVGWSGNVGIGTTGPEAKLTVSASGGHLQLRRESAESAGGKQIYLELYQNDPDPSKLRPEVFPSIRFHHNNRFWHRVEAQSSGFHFKDGNLAGDAYSDIKARNISAAGKLEVSGGGGTNVDLVVNGRLRSNNNDGGLWVAEDRFVGGHSTNQIGFWNGNAWRLTVLPNGNVGIGTIGPPWKLSVSSSKEHLALYREATETVGGTHVFLELAQLDSAPARVPEAFPSIRFHHHNRFSHRIEGQSSGFHFKTGDPASNVYSDIKARNIYSVGNVGIDTANPGSDLEIGNFDKQNRYLTLKVSGGNAYRSGIKLWTWQENYGYSIEYDERGTTGNGLHIRTHNQNADGTTRLFLGWNSNVGIGTTNPAYKLSVSSGREHLQLRREGTETAGGKQVFLELYQDDQSPPRVPDVFPSIRFHHSNRFWHRIEAQGSGFHFKNGNLPSDDYSALRVGAITIGDITIGERELSILQKLAAGNLEFDLYNVTHAEYVYVGDYKLNDTRRYVLTWVPKGTVGQGRWQIHYPK